MYQLTELYIKLTGMPTGYSKPQLLHITTSKKFYVLYWLRVQPALFSITAPLGNATLKSYSLRPGEGEEADSCTVPGGQGGQVAITVHVPSAS
jgi:hypothetical protein